MDYRPALRSPTGVGAFVHELATAIAGDNSSSLKKNDEVDLTLFSSSWKDRLGGPQSMGLPSGASTIDRRIPVRLLNFLWHRMEWPPIETITQERFDVVHSPHPLLLPSREAAQIVTIHDLDFLDHPGHTTNEIRRDYRVLVQKHARRATQIVVPSLYTSGEVTRRLGIAPDSISICRNGSPPWSPLVAPPTSGHLLFVGSLTPRKNVPLLLEAYGILTSRRGNVPDLVLAGHSSSKRDSKWLDAIYKPPFAGKVHLTGYVDKGVLQEFYAKARIVVLPSLDEGFGLPALEAMTLGIPVVASNRGALPEVVGDAGLLADPTDPLAFVNSIERLLDDQGLVANCVQKGFARAQLFSWKASAESLKHVYSEASKKHKEIMQVERRT